MKVSTIALTTAASGRKGSGKPNSLDTAAAVPTRMMAISTAQIHQGGCSATMSAVRAKV